MAFIPVLATAQLTIGWTLHNEECSNTLYVSRDDGNSITPTELDALCTLTEDWWCDNVLPLLSDDVSYRLVEGRALHIKNGPVSLANARAGETGGSISSSEPGNVAITMTFKTGLAGRSFRGRNYIGGIPSDMTMGNTVSGAFTTGLLAAYAGFDDAIGIATYNWVVVSRYANGAARTEGLATPIKFVTLTDPNIDSMRSRLNKRGD